MNSNNPFEYDRSLLEGGMIKISRVRAVKRPRLLQSLTHNQLIAAITIDYHRIEKGMAMLNPVPNFGDKSGVLRRLWNMIGEYRRRYGETCVDPILIVIYDCIKEYENMHKTVLAHEISSPYVAKIISILKYLDDVSDKKLGGTILISSSTAKEFTHIKDVFFESRHSIRQFSPIVDDELLKSIRCSITAAISGTPTVCNRHLNHVYMFSRQYSIRNAYNNGSDNGTDNSDDNGEEVIDKLLKLQNGNRGFGSNIPVLLVVNTCLDAFQDEKERRQPYISGGMFAMSIIYALHARGLATCSLNWDCLPDNDRRLQQILVDLGKISPANYNKETCVMYIGVGRYPNVNIPVTASYKSPLKDILVE